MAAAVPRSLDNGKVQLERAGQGLFPLECLFELEKQVFPEAPSSPLLPFHYPDTAQVQGCFGLHPTITQITERPLFLKQDVAWGAPSCSWQ